jgi:hypothetical protein
VRKWHLYIIRVNKQNVRRWYLQGEYSFKEMAIQNKGEIQLVRRWHSYRAQGEYRR